MMDTFYKNRLHLQFITHFTEKYSYLDSVKIALGGGCRWVQLRMKDAAADVKYSAAVQAMELCRQAGAVFIIDDDVHLVKELGADGVHLGKNDMPVQQARELLGKGYIIGGTANTIGDIEGLYAAGADYIGCGPFRFTTTKEKLSPVLGLGGYKDIVDKMGEKCINIPIVSIGGITADDIPAIMDTGVNGIALSGYVLRADDPVGKMRRIVEIMNTLKNEYNG